MSQLTRETVVAEVEEWIDQNWDESLTLAEWWQRMADAGYSHPMLPKNAGGLGYDRSLSRAVHQTMGQRGVVGPPTGLGTMLAAPTIAAHGTQEQIDRFIPPILNGQRAWCQLFSEPGAGSDLAGLGTKAMADGDEWVVNGQKVWTSGGQIADWGMLIARTDPDQPKHRGITYFAIDMHQEGVDVRPLVEMTGSAMFNEVFLSDARVADADRIAEQGEGWRVANTTLTEERASIGAGGTGAISVPAGQQAGRLDKTVGSLVERQASNKRAATTDASSVASKYIELARKLNVIDDPVIRQKLIGLYTLEQLSKLNVRRAKTRQNLTGGEGNLAKLMNAEMYRQYREVGLSVLGAHGMVMGRDTPGGGRPQELAIFSPAPAIYGGTDQVQRNIIGERVLGLPKEPGFDKSTPYSELPKNA